MGEWSAVLEAFGIDTASHEVAAFGSGLIHSTNLVTCQGKPEYILQRVNHQVFRKPEDIAHNLRVIGNFLKQQAPQYHFTYPLTTTDGQDYAIRNGNYYRIFRFMKGTHSVDVCQEPEQAYEASRQFGKFTAVLEELRTDMLRYTIPGFHDLLLRYNQFLEAISKGDRNRLEQTRDLARFLTERKGIVDIYQHIQNDAYFKKRVTHHDTKISNVLFDENGKGVCVIDLDTVMPGYFFSDMGDMIRTYVSPANEEEQDLDKISIRKDFVKAIFQGYNEEMGDLLSEKERSSFIYSGKFMIYMQALRFYTDHLNNDIYYGAQYEGHNLQRARNQARLLEILESSERELVRLI
jgi:Ser/Thr protein kinase RdoA (MazF antagonist)